LSVFPNRVFPAPISSDYRGSDIEGKVVQFILCWRNNSQSLKSRLAWNFAVVYGPQRDDAFVHADPKLRRGRWQRLRNSSPYNRQNQP
jgi:hypothetical protein